MLRIFTSFHMSASFFILFIYVCMCFYLWHIFHSVWIQWRKRNEKEKRNIDFIRMFVHNIHEFFFHPPMCVTLSIALLHAAFSDVVDNLLCIKEQKFSKFLYLKSQTLNLIKMKETTKRQKFSFELKKKNMKIFSIKAHKKANVLIAYALLAEKFKCLWENNIYSDINALIKTLISIWK